MNLLIGLAFRNLFRNIRRTVITSVAVVAGVMVLILGQGFVDGLDENVIRAQEDAVSGHVLLQPAGYPDDGLSYPLEEAQTPPDALLAQLGDDRVEAWAPRLWFSARIIAGQDSVRGRIIGYDPDRDPRVFPRDRWIIDGALPSAPDQIALGRGLARLLGRKTGDTLFVEARTRAGSINALLFTVSGVLSTGTAATDNSAAFLPMDTADSLARPEGAVSHLAVRLKSGRRGAAEASGWLQHDGWRLSTATEDVADILAVNAVRRRAISLVVFVLMAIAATGIANTVIMATYERVREIGTLRAMGMSGLQIRGLFLLEGSVMGLTAGLLGAVLGVLIVAHYASVGIDLSRLTDEGAMGDLPVSTVLYLHLSWPMVGIALCFGSVVAVLASLYPAHHAATLNPADAVRAD